MPSSYNAVLNLGLDYRNCETNSCSHLQHHYDYITVGDGSTAVQVPTLLVNQNPLRVLTSIVKFSHKTTTLANWYFADECSLREGS